MNFLIIQKKQNQDSHLECFELASKLSSLGCKSICWGADHDNFKTKLPELIDDRSFIICLENPDTKWLPDLKKTGIVTVVITPASARKLISSMPACVAFVERLIKYTDDYSIIKQENLGLYERYTAKYETFKSNHKIFKSGWSSSFYSGHRAANWKLLEMIKQEKDINLLDIGVYDGMFAKLASKYKNVYMKEDHEWNEMWDLIGLDKTKINVPLPKCEIVTLMNIAHNWPLSEIIEKVTDINGMTPNVIYLDSCFSNPHRFNADYCDKEKMSSYGFELVYKKGRMLWKRKNPQK